MMLHAAARDEVEAGVACRFRPGGLDHGLGFRLSRSDNMAELVLFRIDQ